MGPFVVKLRDARMNDGPPFIILSHPTLLSALLCCQKPDPDFWDHFKKLGTLLSSVFTLW